MINLRNWQKCAISLTEQNKKYLNWLMICDNKPLSQSKEQQHVPVRRTQANHMMCSQDTTARIQQRKPYKDKLLSECSKVLVKNLINLEKQKAKRRKPRLQKILATLRKNRRTKRGQF